MSLPKKYKPDEIEISLQSEWQSRGDYHFDPGSPAPVYSIDTPPPTVSGYLHLGHVYSYSHPDFIARFWRMRGLNVFYPMGYDDNGLPTERLVEKKLGITAPQVGRQAFIEKCLQVSEQAEQEYEALWKRLGLSIDWRYTYRTIDDPSRHTSQLSFLQLYKQGLAYRREAPAIWCPECNTAIAQAELNDLERQSEYVDLAFRLQDGSTLAIATTRPELLPACVAIFVHPDDSRYTSLVGSSATVPLFDQPVPILADRAADPEKGTGAVMCCTFGDQTDVAWWHIHGLPLVEAVDPQGKMTAAAGDYAGLPLKEARLRIKENLQELGLLLDSRPSTQTVRIHERCDTPVEYILTHQWFVRILDFKEDLLAAGEQLNWNPGHMKSRYRSWVENLNWDWCISRQRYFGVPFPLWYCASCKTVILANESALPVDPLTDRPDQPCPQCGSSNFNPETDVLDTWATSSMTPQIVGRWLEAANGASGNLYERVFPFSLRPQAHEIIRTWAFYTIAKSHFHFQRLPWRDVLISGWGIAGEGMGKISKSRGGGPMPPMEMVERYSADAVRYWAASTGPGKDSVISEEKIQLGAKLVTKLWNVARFSERFLDGYRPEVPPALLSPADRWILSRAQRLIRRSTQLYEAYDYAAAKSEIEIFVWRDLADNYLEMVKQRLYNTHGPGFEAARFTLYRVLLSLIKLFAPILPHITEVIYQGIFRTTGDPRSIHSTRWPEPDLSLEDEHAEEMGELLVEIATAVRRYKSEQNLPLGSGLTRLQLAGGAPEVIEALESAASDLTSITRADRIEIVSRIDADMYALPINSALQVAIEKNIHT